MKTRGTVIAFTLLAFLLGMAIHNPLREKVLARLEAIPPSTSPIASDSFGPMADMVQHISVAQAQDNGTSVQAFLHWSERHNIRLVGVAKPVNDFYYSGAKERDFLPITDIPRVDKVASGLYLIPEPLLRAMAGKTFYLSRLPGRGYTILSSWSEQNVLKGMARGSILEQPLSELQTIHEFAHIVDFHGIQGLYDDENNYWAHLKALRDEIFQVPFVYQPKRSQLPAGFMDVYSTANAAENFAQHFTFYMLRGGEFRAMAKRDPLLQKKYAFFRQHLFGNREY